MVEPLHQEWNPRQPLSTHIDLEFRETLRHRVDDPVGHVDQVVVHERQRMHRHEAVELGEGRIIPVRPGVKHQRFAGFLDHRIEPRILIVMHRLVAHRADRESRRRPAYRRIRATMFLARLRRIERQIQERR